MGRFTSSFGVVYGALGLLGVAFDEALLGYDADWTAWFAATFALLAAGGWMIWRFDPTWEQSYQSPGGPPPVRRDFRPTVIPGGKVVSLRRPPAGRVEEGQRHR